LEEPVIDEMIMKTLIFRKWSVRVWTGSSWLSIGTVGGRF